MMHLVGKYTCMTCTFQVFFARNIGSTTSTLAAKHFAVMSTHHSTAFGLFAEKSKWSFVTKQGIHDQARGLSRQAPMGAYS